MLKTFILNSRVWSRKIDFELYYSKLNYHLNNYSIFQTPVETTVQFHFSFYDFFFRDIYEQQAL